MTTRAERPIDATLAPLIEQIRTAGAEHRTLDIVGGGTRSFLAAADPAQPLHTGAHRGIVSYATSELVVTARAGTLLSEIEAALAERGQMLGCEPPRLGSAATIGGAVASGWSGPARPYRGSVRDFVLGIELVNGQGELLRFGGQVMKNVAGYDVSRLVTGAFGALGLISEVSLRVVPRPACEQTFTWSLPRAAAHRRMLELPREPWPITAMTWYDGQLRVRISGSAPALADAVKRLQPETCVEDDPFWAALRDFQLAPMRADAQTSLWRLSLPPAAPETEPGADICDWGGAQRWVSRTQADTDFHAFCASQGGHASRLRRAAGDTGATFATPQRAQLALMRRIRSAFDPAGVFNAGRYLNWL